MKKYYLSKNYINISGAGNKAKTDSEKIMDNLGYSPSGLPRTFSSNKILGFMLTLISIILTPFRLKKGDLLVIQYPYKKYYNFICNIAHLRGCKVITLVHDLGSFRRKKLTTQKEIRRIENSDYLLIHNENMKRWLEEQGYSKKMSCFKIWDYLSETSAPQQKNLSNGIYKVMYAGSLSPRKNSFLYNIDPIIDSWKLNLYGQGFEMEQIKNKSNFAYYGFVPSDNLINTVEGDFGLVWDGNSIERCEGNFGEYLQYNNPHKTSLYIRCHLPIIIWKKAALASFITENGIGITIDSLEELNQILSTLSPEDYLKMRENVIRISHQMSMGYYLQRALEKAEKELIK